MGYFTKRRTINLALQGGGAHGAFTWGVLDRLLEDPNIEFGWLSATSAGAVNAAAFTSGWIHGGREGARKAMSDVWTAVYNAGVPELLRLNPFLHGLSRSPTFTQVAGLWSPYDLNPLRIDPLRQLLSELVDFDAIRERGPHELLIAATDVATGQQRLFRRKECCVDTILASACLPTVHHAVEIEGRNYWDGGFSCNPDIVTLGSKSPTKDTLIVKLTPLVQRHLPKGVNEIAGHINQLAFSAPLRRDVETIVTIRKLARGFFQNARSDHERLAHHRYHLIDAGHYTGSLNPQTKMKPDWKLFTYLRDAGQLKAEQWLQSDRKAVGSRSSVDLEDVFLRQPMRSTANSENDSTSATSTIDTSPSPGANSKNDVPKSSESERPRRRRNRA